MGRIVTKVKHRSYGWIGEISADDGISHIEWYRVKWDNGTQTTEHEDDMEMIRK